MDPSPSSSEQQVPAPRRPAAAPMAEASGAPNRLPGSKWLLPGSLWLQTLLVLAAAVAATGVVTAPLCNARQESLLHRDLERESRVVRDAKKLGVCCHADAERLWGLTKLSKISLHPRILP